VVFSIDSLSDREMEVFQLIGNGYSTRQIASKLNLSVKTIDSYREHLKLKLGLGNGTELVRHAIQWVKSQALS
jgi:DNA-binding CsgD family transcriptional regulator